MRRWVILNENAGHSSRDVHSHGHRQVGKPNSWHDPHDNRAVGHAEEVDKRDLGEWRRLLKAFSRDPDVPSQ
jgi:hypothetical protein